VPEELECQWGNEAACAGKIAASALINTRYQMDVITPEKKTRSATFHPEYALFVSVLVVLCISSRTMCLVQGID